MGQKENLPMTVRQAQSIMESGEKTKKKYWTKSSQFNIAIGVIVICNAIVLGVEADYGKENPDVFHVLEHLFCAIFTVELLIHFCVEGFRDYFSDRMNWLDFILVVLAIADVWVIRAAGV